MNNNDDKFLGRPVQFNTVGRMAEGTSDKEVRPVKMSKAQTTRLIVGVVLLIVLAVVVFIASTNQFGVTNTGGGRHQPQALQKPTADPNF